MDGEEITIHVCLASVVAIGQDSIPMPSEATPINFMSWGREEKVTNVTLHARELTVDPPFPFCNCVISNPNCFPWHDHGYRPPAFQDLIVYQFHVGTFSIAAENYAGKFLDVIEKLPYLQALGVNAIQPLPIVEFPAEFSLVYNGTDYFSPEEDYGVSNRPALEAYLHRINGFARRSSVASLSH